jgi:hypothetical protein
MPGPKPIKLLNATPAHQSFLAMALSDKMAIDKKCAQDLRDMISESPGDTDRNRGFARLVMQFESQVKMAEELIFFIGE